MGNYYLKYMSKMIKMLLITSLILNISLAQIIDMKEMDP